jgi:hypothetical protein
MRMGGEERKSDTKTREGFYFIFEAHINRGE